MAAPVHYQFIGGVVLGFVNLVEPVYWIICGVAYLTLKRYTPALLLSVAAGLAYRLFVIPNWIAPVGGASRWDFADVLGIVLACAMMNGLFLLFSVLRARNRAAAPEEQGRHEVS